MGAGWLTSAGLIANQWFLADAWDLPPGPWGSLLYVLPISLWGGVVFGLMLAVLARFPEARMPGPPETPVESVTEPTA